MAHKLLLRRTLSTVALAGVVLSAAGFANVHHASAIHYNDTAHVLNYPNPGTDWPSTFDPDNVTDSQSIEVAYMLYANLVKLDTNNVVKPDLATWSVGGGGKVYTFHLRSDARFSNGKAITADDVIYSLDRALNPKVYNGSPSPVALTYLGHIVGAASYKGKGDVAGLKKIDARTVQITLDSPVVFFLESLAYPTGDVFEKGTPIGGLTTKNPMQNEVSSGPWMISKFSFKSSITFVPNPYFYDAKKMKLRQVYMPFVSTTDTEYQGYESGEYAMTGVPSNRLAAARMQSDFHSSPQLAIDYITYNFAKPPFNNKNLRLAMTYAINRDLINNKVLKGLQTTIYSVVPKGINGYDANGYSYVPHYDLTKAKMYLALAKKELGKNFPTSLTIHYQNTTTDIVHEYTELQYEWKQLGVNVKIQGISFNSWLGLVAKPTTSLTYKGGDPWIENLWIDDFPDAEDFTTNLLSPQTNYNIGNYNNPEFERLITAALTAHGSERTQDYIKASRIALNDVAWTMVGQGVNAFRWKSNITGLVAWSGEVYPVPLNNDWTNVDVM